MTTVATIEGVGVGQGVAHGPVVRMSDPLPTPDPAPSARSVAEEAERVRAAVSTVADELAARGRAAGGTAAEVLDAQIMMAEDPALAEVVDACLSRGLTAQRAVHEAFAEFRANLEQLGGYLAERAADLDDVAQRVIAQILGVPAPGLPVVGHPHVLVARDLAPADTALLDFDQVLALVTVDGGPTSHTAILAREKGLVAVVGAPGARALVDGQQVIVDAAAGIVRTDPDEQAIAAADARIQERARAAEDPVVAGALADGTAVPLLANLGSADQAEEAVARGAEGVGLFRTEFLFLSAEVAPTVEAQQAEYTRLLAAFAGRKVVVRVLDAGADKPLPFLNEVAEENPALGVRGLRILRVREQILRDQLTALAGARAATEADLWVMAPMVATVEEAQYFTALAREHGLPTAGVMVEIPSSALLADKIFAEADFASIGTNDLTQYTLAADRLLGAVAGLQDPWHPAVLRLVSEVGAAGRRQGKAVGICGEAAADPLLAVVLVGLGATTLSMSPSALADVRASLRRYTLDQASAAAAAALDAVDAQDARRLAGAALGSAPVGHSGS